jgi:hypothetical protein
MVIILQDFQDRIIRKAVLRAEDPELPGNWIEYVQPFPCSDPDQSPAIFPGAECIVITEAVPGMIVIMSVMTKKACAVLQFIYPISSGYP